MDWQPIDTHPKKDSAWFTGRRRDGSEVIVHWAQDLSGSEQPAFSGFFRQVGNSFVEVDDLTHWRPGVGACA